MIVKGLNGVYESYEAYLRSDEWQWKRKAFLSASDVRFCCEMCADPNIKAAEVHHVTYERLGQKWSDDVICLCAACHMDAHGGLAGIGARLIFASSNSENPYAEKIKDYVKIRNARRRGDIAAMMQIWEDQWKKSKR